ncbi:AI-2E family transporter [Paracoccus sp. p4-l81]|uniref:AI-2E family transporter n=1 Tax=unclassified Paracoccus (in: a-proteobacteria) TaxID=2688777 RepID=UPI0035BA37F6
MALPVRQQVIYWSVAAIVFLLVMWGLGNTLLPFIMAAAVAYLLDPIADWLERKGLSRTWAVALITLAAALALIMALLVLVPLLVSQATQLVASAPDMFARLQEFLAERFPQALDENSPVRGAIGQIGEGIQARGGELLQGVMASVGGVLNALVFMVIVPVAAFYLLLDWDGIVTRVDRLLPRDHAPTIRILGREVDEALSGFIRGEAIVISVLAVYYSITLMAVGLPFGLVVGVITGAVSFIPYVGAIIGGTLAIGLALFNFWGDPIWIGAVIGIFVIGQILEGNILVPRLVGSYVGLHPVWLLMSLSVFGALFGFAGMLVAVPIAAALGVLVRFFVKRYEESVLYQGRHANGVKAPAVVSAHEVAADRAEDD